jgi:8-oxo-dGTP pyrophosphatase MutT (NUDIX family)
MLLYIAIGANNTKIIGGAIISACAVAFTVVNGQAVFLLVQEMGNAWGLAGGAKSNSDTNLLEALHRELREELSIEQETDYRVLAGSTSRSFVYDHPLSDRLGKKGVIVFFLVEVHNKAAVKASGEIKKVAWFTLEEALQKFAFKHVESGFRELASVGLYRSSHYRDFENMS